MTIDRAATDVSIVVPAYNPGPFLRETLESFCSQSVSSWEAIVVDDGSAEDLSWVDTFDSRIRRLRQENRGLPAARNSGVAVASAPLVAFCDADDRWRPDKLRRQLAAFAADPLLDLSHTAFDRIDGSGGYVGPGFTQHFRDYADLLHGCGICVSTVVVRRTSLERVGGFDPTLRAVEDWDMWLRIANGGRLSREDSVLADYRVHDAGMSRDLRLIAGQWQVVLARHESPTATRDIRAMKHHLGAQAYDDARAALRSRSPYKFATGLGVALRWAPSFTARSIFTKALSRS